MAQDETHGSDEELMRRCAEGDVAAFEVIFGRYAPSITSFALRMIGDRDLAESLAQEAFLRLLRNASSYSYPRRFSSWIFAIARNVCLDEIRKKKPMPHAADSSEQPGDEKAPPERLIRDEEEHQLATAIEALPPDQREVLILRAFHGLSYAEIAEAVGCNESTARSRMDYALGRLRKALRKKDI